MSCPGGEGTSATGETIREGQCTHWLGPGGGGEGEGERRRESRVNVRTYVSMEGSLASVNENTALSLHNMFV